MRPPRFGHTLGCFEDLSEALHAPPVRHQSSPFQWGLRWDSPLARGSVSNVEVRPGLNVVALDLFQSQEWSLDVVHEATGFELGFHRSSNMEITLADGAALGVESDQFYVSQVSRPTPLRLHSRRGATRSIALQMSADDLRALLGEETLPDGFSRVLHNDAGFATVKRRSTSQINTIVDELSTCRLTGAMRRLYFESKTLELIVLAAQALGEERMPVTSLPRAEVERLEYARELLLKELQHPPSIRELSRRCGLNERKLKEGFKLRFGTTVFGFVRHQRLSQARDLLQGNASVMAVAQAVGYANPSKFAAAFRREFGMAPSALLA